MCPQTQIPCSALTKTLQLQFASLQVGTADLFMVLIVLVLCCLVIHEQNDNINSVINIHFRIVKLLLIYWHLFLDM